MDRGDALGCVVLIFIVIVWLIVDSLVQRSPKNFVDEYAFYDVVADTAHFYVLSSDSQQSGINVYQFSLPGKKPDTIYRIYKGKEPVDNLHLVPLYNGQWVITGDKIQYDFWLLTTPDFRLLQAFFVKCPIKNVIPVFDGFAVFYKVEYECRKQFGDFDYVVLIYDFDGNLISKFGFSLDGFQVKTLLWQFDSSSFMFLAKEWNGEASYLKITTDTVKRFALKQYFSQAFLSDSLVLLSDGDNLKIFERRKPMRVFNNIKVSLNNELVFARIRDSVLIYIPDRYDNAKKVKLIDLATGEKDYFRVNGSPWLQAADIFKGNVIAVGTEGTALLAVYPLKYEHFEHYRKQRKEKKGSRIYYFFSPFYRLIGR